MDITAYIADLKDRIQGSIGKRASESAVTLDISILVSQGIALTHVGANGAIIGTVTLPIRESDPAEFAAKAEAALSLVLPEVPRPKVVSQTITVAVEEPLNLGGAEKPADPPPEKPAEDGVEVPKFLRRR